MMSTAFERRLGRRNPAAGGGFGGGRRGPLRLVEAPSEWLPGDDLVGLEDRLEQGLVGELVGHPIDLDAFGEVGNGGGVQHRDLHPIAGRDLPDDDDLGQVGIGALEQVQDRGHQKIMKRRACCTSSAIRSRLTGITGWPSAFQSGSVGTAAASTWKGTPSVRRLPRNLAMSSPSTSSSVSSSRRWTAPSVSTNVTWFSPATTPTPMRMASKARWLRRGSLEIRTRTGWSSDTKASVQRDEAIGPVDDIGQDHQPAVGELGRVFQRDLA